MLVPFNRQATYVNKNKLLHHETSSLLTNQLLSTVMNSFIVLSVLLFVSASSEEYKFDENAEILYTYEQDGVQIEVLKKGESTSVHYFHLYIWNFYEPFCVYHIF